jgi:hypothetical protein
MESALYLGSAAQVLGLFHVEVQEEEQQGWISEIPGQLCSADN